VDPEVLLREKRRDEARLIDVERIWSEATPNLPAWVIDYLAGRGIAIERLGRHGLRYHPTCIWRSERLPCLLARFTDAITGEPRGLWRRMLAASVKLSLGPNRGCVIRLAPRIGKRLVIGEGIETTLSGTCITYEGKLLCAPYWPAWACGDAGHMKALPVIDGVEQLVILVDNDDAGIEAAAECESRWRDAGRRVVRLMPPEPGTDFNDWIRT